MEEALLVITMPNYPRKVLLSKSRRAKYFKPGDRLPLKYLQKEIIDHNPNMHLVSYGYDKDVKPHLLRNEFCWLKEKKRGPFLANRNTQEFIIKNPRVAGTENWEVINGNYIYNGKYNSFTQGKIMKAIHDYVATFLEGIQPLPLNCFPIVLNAELFDKSLDSISGEFWDVDNRSYPYMKAFMDCLQKFKIIPRDDVRYVRQPPIPRFHELKEEEEPRFVIKIFKAYADTGT